MRALLLVAIGGAVGTAFRYLLGLLPIPGDFPFMTMLINFLGSVLIGFVVSTPGISNHSLLFLKTGVCGGFTTFSTFSLDSFLLLQKGKTFLGICNLVGSVVVCLAGVFLGISLSRILHPVS